MTIEIVKLPTNDINAFGRFLIRLKFIVGAVNLLCKRRFTCATFTHNEEFDFVKRLTLVGVEGLKVEI